MARPNIEGDLILAIFHLFAICSWGSFGKISWKTWNPGKCFSDNSLIWKSKSLFRVFLKTSFYMIFFGEKLKRSSWIKLCPKIIMWSMFFLSSSIKIITQLQWRKHGKSECNFFSCDVCDVMDLEMIMPCIQLLCSVIGGSRGVELLQGHGFEIEPICLLWQSLFYWCLHNRNFKFRNENKVHYLV